MASSNFTAFPSDRRSALAILYLQNQDLSGKTPEEIAHMYNDAYGRIDSAFDAMRDEKKQQRRSRDTSMI